MSESPSGKREGLQVNATGKKGKFITDSSQGLCHNQCSGAGSESPEPRAQAVTQIYRVSTRHW